MTQPKGLLITNSIDRAEETLIVAKNNLNLDLRTVQNRNYYAVFYIVLALAYLDGFQTGKHHKLMGWFNKEYIHKHKIFDKKLNEIYKKLITSREKFDYSVSEVPELNQVEEDLKDAEFFVQTVKKHILERLKNE